MISLKYERSLYKVSDSIFCALSSFFGKAQSRSSKKYIANICKIKVQCLPEDKTRLCDVVGRRIKLLIDLHLTLELQVETPNNEAIRFYHRFLNGTFYAQVIFKDMENVTTIVYPLNSLYVIVSIPTLNTRNESGSIVSGSVITKIYVYKE